jgi:hypothetical protein
MSRHSSLVIKDDKTYIKFKTLCLELGQDLQDVVWQFIEKKVAEYDGQKNGIENFFDKSFVPKPEIDADLETKILPWLRTLSDEKLHQMVRNFYPGHIFAKALLDTPQDQRKNTGYDYQTIWRQYK